MNAGKQEIRRAMRARRRALSAAERARASEVVCGKLVSLPAVGRAVDPADGRGACAVYLASSEEIDLAAAAEHWLDIGATVVAPRWNGKAYELARLKSLKDEDLRKGPMGILEPKDADLVPPKDVAVWLVPGLAFAKDGGRLGYGGGWYDRLMAGASKHSRKFGIAYGFQVVESLPSEPHDIRLDGVIIG